MKVSIPLSPVSTECCQLSRCYSASLTTVLPGENGCLIAIPPAPSNPFTRALAYPVGNYGTLSAISELDPLTRAHPELREINILALW